VFLNVSKSFINLYNCVSKVVLSAPFLWCFCGIRLSPFLCVISSVCAAFLGSFYFAVTLVWLLVLVFRDLGFCTLFVAFRLFFHGNFFHGSSIVVVIGFASFPLLLRCCSSFPNVILRVSHFTMKKFSNKVYLSLTILCQVSQESDQPSSKILYLLTKSKIVKRIN